MEKVGTVVEILNNRAKVRCLYRCDSECSFCPASHLFAKSDEPLDIEALNLAGAQEGDTVRIELDAAASLSAYGLAYGTPILGLVAGALAGARRPRPRDAGAEGRVQPGSAGPPLAV